MRVLEIFKKTQDLLQFPAADPGLFVRVVFLQINADV
jgi:hypothetical protein